MWVDNCVRNSLPGIAFPSVISLIGLCSAFTRAHDQLLFYKANLAFLTLLVLYLPFSSWHGRAIETVLRRQKALVLTVSLGSLRLPTAPQTDMNNFKKFGKP